MTNHGSIKIHRPIWNKRPGKQFLLKSAVSSFVTKPSQKSTCKTRKEEKGHKWHQAQVESKSLQITKAYFPKKWVYDHMYLCLFIICNCNSVFLESKTLHRAHKCSVDIWQLNNWMLWTGHKSHRVTITTWSPQCLSSSNVLTKSVVVPLFEEKFRAVWSSHIGTSTNSSSSAAWKLLRSSLISFFFTF